MLYIFVAVFGLSTMERTSTDVAQVSPPPTWPRATSERHPLQHPETVPPGLWRCSKRHGAKAADEVPSDERLGPPEKRRGLALDTVRASIRPRKRGSTWSWRCWTSIRPEFPTFQPALIVRHLLASEILNHKQHSSDLFQVRVLSSSCMYIAHMLCLASVY